MKRKDVADTVNKCRELYAKGQLQKYTDLKKSLPAFVFMSTMKPNTGSKGTKKLGMHRIKEFATLNGLIMHDYDKLSKKGMTWQEVYDAIPRHWFDDGARFQVMLAHPTVSGDGLRLVTIADPKLSIEDNQQAVATALSAALGRQLVADESVKNPDRASFAVTENDILFINERIFDYDNPEYDKAFGIHPQPLPSGRGVTVLEGCKVPDANATPLPCRGGVGVGSVMSPSGEKEIQTPPLAPPLEGRGAPAGQGDGTPAGAPAGQGSGTPAGAPAGQGDGTLEYKGVEAQKIIDEWTKQHGWKEGEPRHPAMIELAGDLLTIIERDPAVLERWLRLAPFVQSIIRERGDDEVKKAAADACGWTATPFKRKEFKQVLTKVKAVKRRTASKDEEELKQADLSMYSTYWERLKPLLAPPYDVACSLTDDYNKLGAVFAAGAMFCTLMTRCWYEHFDGMQQRMNPQVYIIGMPAAGKSFADRLNNIIMGPMRAADEVGREAEREYNRKLKERQTSSKAAKGEALKRPDIMVRYCLSKTSNSVLFRRMMNAKETIDGEEMHLHLYTFDSELDANTAAQKGGSWIDKHDIELKAFHNEETGVDYNNVDSSNGVYQVFYNSVCTGTPLSLNRKINMRNVNDGLCSRIAFFRMVPDGFHMIKRGSRIRNHEQECQLKQWAFRFDTMKGELGIKPLVDHVYNLCEQATFEAEASGDRVLDFLRKRAVFYATWFTIPRIYGRQWDSYQKTGEVTVDQSDLDFAKLMYDAVIYWQDRFFGRMLQESWDNAENENKPRVNRSRNDSVLAALPGQFSFQQAMDQMQMSKGATGAQLNRWVKQGSVERLEYGQYRKRGQQS